MANIIKAFNYAQVFSNGQRVTAVILCYDSILAQQTFRDLDFEVTEYGIKKIYTNNEPKRAIKEQEGNYVVIELGQESGEISTIKKIYGKDKISGENKFIEMVHEIPSITVSQKHEIRTKAGEKIHPFDAMQVSRTIQETVDSFQVFALKDMLYNLFIPKEYDGIHKYPLLLFLHDAEPCGMDPMLTLTQGRGAVCFAEEEGNQHPCFVLAPQLPKHLRPMDHEDTNDIATRTKEILDHVKQNFFIDEKQIYATGQSGGCMAICELNYRYPDLFCASYLVAGQWKADRMKRVWNKRFWICVSENDKKAYNGMLEAVEEMKANGAKVWIYSCDARESIAQINQKAKEAIDSDTNIKLLVWQGNSVVPEQKEKNSLNNHLNTWKYAYEIEAIRNWIFTGDKS